MSLPTFAHMDVVVLTASKVETRTGSYEYDWSTATETTVSGCYITQTGGSSNITDRDQRQVDAVCYMPPGTSITADDRVKFGGLVYVIEGQPAQRVSPSGALDHIEVSLRTWRG